VGVVDNSAADLESVDIRWHLHSQTDPVRHAEAGPLMITAGDGPYVSDINGRKYLDAVASLWCASLGFSDARLVQAANEALKTLPCYHTFNHRSNPYCAELSARVAAVAPFDDAKVFFTDGGSGANDSMVKMAWYYHVARGRAGKRKIISRIGAFHGSTVFAARLSGLPLMHQSFNLPDCNVVYTGRPHYYRDARADESPVDFAARLASELEALIEAEGADTIAAFIAEPVMGAGGGLVPPRGYWEKMQAVIRKYDLLFIADEVICGFGRTGNMWGSQTYDLKPDLISCAKALSAGMQPISATLINERVFQAMLDESRKLGGFAHGFTYAGHPVTTAVAMETLRIYDEMDMIGHVQRVGPYMQSVLGNFREHPLVGDVRGVGLITGLELMENKATGAPFDPARKVGAMVDKHARKHGLIARLIGDRVAFSPPLIITEAEIDEVAARLRRALDDTMAELRAH
jgi:4-aminobutyrate---pyruvate transaminase